MYPMIAKIATIKNTKETTTRGELFFCSGAGGVTGCCSGTGEITGGVETGGTIGGGVATGV